MTEVVLILALLLTVGILVVGLLYFQYRNTPAARWKARVRAAVAEQEARLRLARRDLAVLARDADDRALRNEFLMRQLDGVAVEELARYPGIGPVTVSRLRDAGLATVAACARARLSAIDGIGPVREKDLKEALKQVRREAESRFDAGASPQAAAYRTEVQKHQAERDRRRQAAEAGLKGAEAGLVALRNQVRIAEGVTFWGHLARGPRVPGLTAEVMSQPLPVDSPTVRSMPAEPEAGARATPAGSGRDDLAPEAGVALAPASGSAGPPVPQIDTTPVAKLRVVAGLGFAMAKADGRIAAAERKQVRAFVERRYTPSDLAAGLDTILSAVEAELPTLGDVLWNVKRTILADAWPELYQFAESVADSAGQRNTREIECLARVAEELGVNVVDPGTAGILPAPAGRPETPEPGAVSGSARGASDDTAEARAGRMPAVPRGAAPPFNDADCRTALEIAPETPLSVDLIRRQYRLLSDRFAPDKFATHGPEFVQMAAEKRVRAERAARHLLAEYNEPLEPTTPPPPADLRHNPDLDDVFGA